MEISISHAAHDYSQYADPLGLVLSDNATLTAEDIAKMLEIAGEIGNAQQWLQGDLVNYSRKTNNDAWIDLLSHNLTLGTLNNRASVASKFTRERRRIGLSFSHHTAVAKLDEAGQDYWLNRAEKERMTRDVLRDLIKAEVPTETIRKSELMVVGMIDLSLMDDFGLAAGQEVRVVFEIVAPKNVVNLVQPMVESEAAA